jgi:hypothetical protein
MPGLITRKARMELARSIYRDILTQRDRWYVFGAKTTPWVDAPIVPADCWEDISQVHRDIIFIRKILPSEVVYLVRRVNWTQGTVYDIYDHTDPTIHTKNYYILTSANRVYKCISNNGGKPSTVEPTSEEAIELVATGDGYKWKFLYTILPQDVTQFLTPEYFPVRYYSSTNSFNLNGYIKTITVTNGGSGYDNPSVLISGDGVGAVAVPTVVDGVITEVTVVEGGSNYSFATASIVDNGDGTDAVLEVEITSESLELDPSAPNQQVASVGALPGAIQAAVVISKGTGYVDGATLLRVRGDGHDAALVPSITLGEIRSVEVASEGEGYTFAEVEIVGAGSGAVVRPIVSPFKGHGSNAPQELGANILGIKTTLDDPNLFVGNDYHQFGLIKNVEDMTGNLADVSVGEACYIITVSETDYDLFDTDDVITTSLGGEFIVVQKETDGATYWKIWLCDVIPLIDGSSILTNETQQNSANISINSLTLPTINKRSGEIVFVESIASQMRDPVENETFQLYLKF